MTHGSLFSGIGGFDLAAEWLGWENKFHCELNPFGQRVLKYYWPNAESFEDITKTDFTKYHGTIDIISGGFPCQDASIALQNGNGQQGLSGKRTGLFFEMARAIDEIRPKYVVAENVANFLKINGGEDAKTLLGEFARMGYNAEWRICRSSEIGSPHHRARLYLVAYSDRFRLQKDESFYALFQKKIEPVTWEFAGTTLKINKNGFWKNQSPILCVDDGFSIKLDGITFSKWRNESIKAYGNAVVPQVIYQIFKAIELFDIMNSKQQ